MFIRSTSLETTCEQQKGNSDYSKHLGKDTWEQQIWNSDYSNFFVREDLRTKKHRWFVETSLETTYEHNYDWKRDGAPVYIALGTGSAMRHRHPPSFPPGMCSVMSQHYFRRFRNIFWHWYMIKGKIKEISYRT